MNLDKSWDKFYAFRLDNSDMDAGAINGAEEFQKAAIKALEKSRDAWNGLKTSNSEEYKRLHNLAIKIIQELKAPKR